MSRPDARRAAICIVGAGPAGITLAARLAQLGHDVCLVERATFPRRRLGESLTPGVRPLLENCGLGGVLDAACCERVKGIQVTWDAGRDARADADRWSLLVDRGRFDQLLLENARSHGVRVLQPAVVRERYWDGKRWQLHVEAGGSRMGLEADLLADASGRSALSFTRSRPGECRTVALYAYWTGASLPSQPRIVAGAEEWYWGVPLPDGTYNTLVFVDRASNRGAEKLTDRFHALIDGSGLLAGCRDVTLAGPVQALEATPYLAPDAVTPYSIKVGDAALAIDPLSSTGVQKAIQTALSAAVVVNTLMRRPESGDIACRFYRASLEEAAARHRVWAATQYAAVAASGGGGFWRDRAIGAEPAVHSSLDPGPDSAALDRQVVLSSRLQIIDRPCLDGDFVVEKAAVMHPGLDGPVAYVGGLELVPLLRRWRHGMTSVDFARAWTPVVSLPRALELVTWLLARGVLVQVDSSGE